MPPTWPTLTSPRHATCGAPVSGTPRCACSLRRPHREPITADPVAGFADAATDPGLAAWATFHDAISTLTLREDPAAADEGFARALELAPGDPFLESYVIRHQGDLMINWKGRREAGIALLRRSLHLRAALGARPQVAAAAATLAGELPPGPEADELRAISKDTARELGIPWLQG